MLFFLFLGDLGNTEQDSKAALQDSLLKNQQKELHKPQARIHSLKVKRNSYNIHISLQSRKSSNTRKHVAFTWDSSSQRYKFYQIGQHCHVRVTAGPGNLKTEFWTMIQCRGSFFRPRLKLHLNLLRSQLAYFQCYCA